MDKFRENDDPEKQPATNTNTGHNDQSPPLEGIRVSKELDSLCCISEY